MSVVDTDYTPNIKTICVDDRHTNSAQHRHYNNSDVDSTQKAVTSETATAQCTLYTAECMTSPTANDAVYTATAVK